MGFTAYEIERRNWIARELLAKREPKDLLKWWGNIYGYAGKEDAEQRHIANAFLLSCLVDYRRRVKNDDPWYAVRAFLEQNPDFQHDLWKKITSDYSQQEWCTDETFGRYKLHWMRPAHNRLWPIAENIPIGLKATPGASGAMETHSTRCCGSIGLGLVHKSRE